MVKSIKLTGRITESKSSKEDIKFVLKKLDQGMDQASIVREAIKYYRKFEEGTLFNDVLEDKLSTLVQLLQSKNLSPPSTRCKENKDMPQIRSKIDSKLKSGDWGF